MIITLTFPSFIKSDNLKIDFNRILVDESNLLIKAQDGVKIYDLNNEIIIESENITYDRKNNIISSLSNSTILDKFDNIFKTKKKRQSITNITYEYLNSWVYQSSRVKIFLGSI